MQCQCVIKTVIDGLHPMIIFEIKSFVYKLNLLDAKPRMIISYTKSCVFFRESNFWGSSQAPQAFLHFWTSAVGVFEPVSGLSPKGVSSTSCYYPTQVFFFFFFYHFKQLCDFVGLRPTIPSSLINHQCGV